MAMDDFAQEEEQTTETTGQDTSVSYIEISEEDHPGAYPVISQGGPIRSFFRGKSASVDDFFADLIEALGPYFKEGDKVPLLRWLGPSADDLEAYVETRDDLEGAVETVDQDE